MKTPTLYERILQLESADQALAAIEAEPRIDLTKAEKLIFEEYKNKKNPIIERAISGEQSIESTLMEIGEINKGVNHYIPWKRDKEHNKKLSDIGKLIKEPYHLFAGGLFYPDNFVTTTLMATALSYVVGSVMCHYASSTGVPPDFNIRFTIASALFVAPLIGAMRNLTSRNHPLPIDQARYLDGKIKELYSK